MKIFDMLFGKKRPASTPRRDEIEMRVRQILRGHSEDVIRRVISTLRDAATTKPIPDPASSEFEDSVRFIHDYEVDRRAKSEGREEDRLFTDWGDILVTKTPHEDKHSLGEMGDDPTNVVSKEAATQGKKCAICGEAVDQGQIQCPKCNCGIFDAPKTPKELRTGGSLPKGLREDATKHRSPPAPQIGTTQNGNVLHGDDVICPTCGKRLCSRDELRQRLGPFSATASVAGNFVLHCPHCGTATKAYLSL